MKKELFDKNVDFCDFCKTLIGNGTIINNKTKENFIICYPCCDEMKIDHTEEPIINRWWNY